ncbi:MAG: hypothetical protein EOP06_09625 [Proteobacteria bacterium]|nr:MAG: hypothetical protein EOP06_09625 [Pseudomonadota bacterium]
MKQLLHGICASAGVIFRTTLLFFSLCTALVPALAQTKPTPLASTDIAAVTVEGRRLFDIGPSETATAAQRATRINRRLQNLIDGEEDLPAFSPDNVKVQGGEQVITLGNVEVLTITQRDAEDAGQGASDLALVQGAALSQAVIQARESNSNVFKGAGILIANSLRGLVNSFLGWLPRVFAAGLLFGVFYFHMNGKIDHFLNHFII